MPTVEDLLVEAFSNSDDADVLARTGRELQARSRLASARTVLSRAVELGPDADPDRWTSLAFAQFRDLRPERGLETLRRGIEATDSDDLRACLAGFTDDPEEAKSLREGLAASKEPGLVAEGLSHRFFRGDAAALDELRALHDAHPDDENVAETVFWVMFRGLHMNAVEKDEARRRTLPFLDTRMEERPDRVELALRKATLLSTLEDWDGLLEATATALERFPDEETLLQLRGKALRETGDLDRAVACLNRAIGAKPTFAGARADLGKTYEAMDRLDLAEEVLREIPVANPSYAGGAVSLSLFLARRERWEEAENVFLESFDRMPSWLRTGLATNPDARLLMERPRVKEVLAEEEQDGESM